MKAKAKDQPKVKNPKVTPEAEPKISKVKEAKAELEAYLKKNKLDPTKDYTKDKKHGSKIKELLTIIKTNQEKIKDATIPEKHHNKTEDKKKKSEAEDKKPKAEKVISLPKDSRKVEKYDYPLVDGKEMTSDEKKKYRVRLRAEKKRGTKDAVKISKVSEKKVEKPEETKKVMKKKLKTKKVSKDD